MASELPPGTRIEKFRVVRTLGKGRAGETYLALDTEKGRHVALTYYSHERFGNKQISTPFLDAVRTKSSFEHPSIAAVVGTGEHADRPFVAFEYVEGESLRERMKAGGLVALRELVRIGAGVAAGLAEAHKKNAFHHDLRPEKIALGRDGSVKILDLGITRLVQRVLSSTPTGSSLSQVSDYLAPEQVRGDAPAGAADVWALGVMLYELATGLPPYSSRVAQTFIEQVGNPDKVRRMPTTPRATPAEISDVIYKLLDKAAAQRPIAQEAHDLLRRMLALAIVQDAPPYSGLAPYVEAQAAYFCGRDAEIAACVERLQRTALLVIAGASGTGKTSFVQAGLFTRLRPEYEPLVIVPGNTPLSALQAAFPDEVNLPERLRADPSVFGAAVARRADKAGKRLVLFIDRCEQVAGHGDASVFLRAVAGVARDRQSPVRVIVAMNEALLDRLAPELDARREVFVLKAPDAQTLAEIVQRPIATSGHSFDDATLPGTIAQDAATVSHPLLRVSFLMSQLWAKRDVNQKVLQRADYDALGGVARVLELYADWALSGATPEQRRIVHDICLRLVSRDEVAQSVPREALLVNLGKGCDEVLDRLVGVGLILSTQASADAQPELELMHDALIEAWPLLRQWLDERGAEIGFLNELEQAAAAWKADGAKTSATYSGDALHLTAEKLKSVTLPVSNEINGFVGAGLKREARERATRKTIVAGIWIALGVVAAGTTAYGLRQYKTVRDLEAVRAQTAHERADAQREDARSALTAARLGGGGGLVQARAQTRTSLEAEDSTLGRTLWAELDKSPLVWRKSVGSEASTPAFDAEGKHVQYAKGTSLVTLDGTTSEAQVARLALDARVRAVAVSSKGLVAIADQKGAVAMLDAAGKTTPVGHAQGAVTALAFSPEGTTLVATTKSGAHVFSVGAPGEPTPLKAGSRAAAFRPSGGELALIGGDDNVLIVDAKSFAEQAKLDVEGVRALAYRPEGLLTGDSDGRVKLWSGKGEARVLIALQKEIVGLAASADKLATLTSDGVLALWDVQKAQGAAGGGAQAKADRGAIAAIAFTSKDGGKFVTIGDDATAELWDLTSAKVARTLSGHTKRIQVLDVSADGSFIATGGADGATRVWSASGDDVKTLAGGGAVRRVRIVDKNTVVTGHADGNIRVWNVAKGASRNAVRAYGDIAMTISPDGKKALTAGNSGPAQVWNVKNGRGERTISPSGARFTSATYSPQSTEIATGDSKGKVQLWPAKGPGKAIGAHEGAVNQVIFDASGKKLISAGADRMIIIWDIAGGDPVKIADVGFEPKTVSVSKDGTKLVAGGADGALKAFTLPLADPYWRAPLLLKKGPEVVTHAGFVPLAQAEQAPGDKAWRKSVFERARLAGESRDSALVCFLSRDKLELWDAAGDKLVSQNPASKIEDLIVTPKGCVTRAAGLVNFYPSEGEVRTVSATATAIGLDGDAFVVAEQGSVTAFSADGQKGASVPVPAGVIAVGRSGEIVVVGFDDGGLEAHAGTATLVLGAGPTARITRIIPGPPGTIAASDADGFVGLWDASSGRLLDQRRLPARPTQLVFAGSGIYAADERGGFASLDLSILTLDYCALLKTVWSAVPVVWSSGRAVLTPPPTDHRCR
ncbi:MAG: protein kinase [Deltaproteobacteria bacterium]|nr:protein kinase [Deltaproteobacteria bacterium]